MDFNNMTALEIGQMIKDKKTSAEEVTKSMLDTIKAKESNINAFTNVFEESAMKNAAEVQAKIESGELTSPLAGVPMGIKDNICTKGLTTSCGSKMLENFVPPYNATVVEKLQDAGAVVLGKLNMDEFAMGGSTETSHFGPTRNPWDLERVPGGSIRQPCSFCGVSGIKPTYGAVSRYGLVAFASSLDQIGPIGRDIKDCATVLETISGHDAKDSTSIKGKVLDFSKCFDGDISGMKIGIPKNYFGDGLDEDVKIPVLEAAKTLEKLGATLEEFEMPVVDYAIPTYYVVACAEASSNLSRYDGIKYGYRSPNGDNLLDVFYNSRSEGFGMEVKRRIMLGSFVLSSGYYDAYYKKGLQVRRLIKNSFADAFEKYDMILSPVAPTVAYKIGENSSDPLKMYLGDIYTVSVNLAGLPGVTVPCGFGANGMPVGMQLIGDTFTEDKLVKVAYAFQKETDFHTKKGGRA